VFKPRKITVKAVRDRRPTVNGQEDQVHVHHAKTTLTVIFHRFHSAPVWGIARNKQPTSGVTGRCSSLFHQAKHYPRL
jgi:hypothetical protein